MKRSKYRIAGVISGIVMILLAILFLFQTQKVAIKSVVLSTPNNVATQEDINVELDKPSSVYVEYWIKGSSEKFKTISNGKQKNYTAHLLLLQTDTTYEYQIIVHNLFKQKSKVYSFQTREQSPWLVFNWVNNLKPHDASALGDGMVMLCYGRTPGYIAMVDGTGAIRWYWQIDDIGVRAAKFTPRGTILAMLRPPVKDAIDDKPKSHEEIAKETHGPMRRGSIGFAGGTAIAEIDLTGKMLWRMDLDKNKDPELHIIHHDVLMDEQQNIYTLYRPKKIVDMTPYGGNGIDTLGGDGIVKLDTLGNVLKKWSAWDVWDIDNDPQIMKFAYDRFHMNSLTFDKDSNFLVSAALENQVWKINAKTGELMWKFGQNGDFKMDTSSYFAFQHSLNINSEGDLMLFDNSLFRKESRGLSFHLDTTNWTATTHIDAPLPKQKYTSRMGSSYLLPNGNLLQTSAKTGTVMVTSREGKDILWQLDSYYVPYRAEYVPASIWNKYFVKE